MLDSQVGGGSRAADRPAQAELHAAGPRPALPDRRHAGPRRHVRPTAQEVSFQSVFWIRIYYYQCFGSGSARFRIKMCLLDPDLGGKKV